MADRYRHWSIIFYPESCPENFDSIIDSWFIPASRSPLHDPALNQEGSVEDQKKPHYHLILEFKGTVPYEDVLELAMQLGTKVVERVRVLTALKEYHIHFYHPNKQQFPGGAANIVLFNGADLEDCFKGQVRAGFICEEIENIIKSTRIDNLIMLQKYLSSDEAYSELLDYIRFHNVLYTKSLLDGMYQLNQKKLSLESASEIYKELQQLDD